MPYDVECVTLLITRQSSSPACVVVSPDGLLRYWFNVSLDTSFAEVNIADLRGELPMALVNTQVRETVVSVLVSLACFAKQLFCLNFTVSCMLVNSKTLDRSVTVLKTKLLSLPDVL